MIVPQGPLRPTLLLGGGQIPPPILPSNNLFVLFLILPAALFIRASAIPSALRTPHPSVSPLRRSSPSSSHQLLCLFILWE